MAWAAPVAAQMPQVLMTGAQAAPRLDFTPDEMALATAVAGNADLAAYYGSNGLRPMFSGPQGAARADALRAAVAAMPDHGLPLARYRADALAATDPATPAGEVLHARILARVISDLTGGMVRPQSADPQIHRQVSRRAVADNLRDFAASPDPARFLSGLGPQDRRYRVLQDALAQRARLIAPAGAPAAPEGLWRDGARDPRLADLRLRLASIGFDAGPAADPALYDDALAQAVLAYQQAAGLPADGVAGPRTIQRLNAGADRQTRAILIALERFRWMGDHDLNARHVWVNIPDYMVRVFEGGQEIFQTRGVIGKTSDDMQTPEFSDEMEYVVVNPSWNVPPGMFARDYFPRLQQNRNAFAHLDVVDRRGRVVPRDQIDFGRYTARSFPYRLRQKPSDDNALGIVKFIFPNQWNIYLHDTPSKGLFGESARAFSNGCVRVRDPLDFAHLLLSQQTDNPQRMFQRARDSGRETYLKLTPFVPVHLVYFTAFPDDSGQMRFYNDVYGRDATVWQAMTKAGLEPDA
ncbi:murein L,D-transpeptidase [Paracoccus sp. (in: a-proteobacteria)]|uniref:L,D-transpeptidase family protein n=1 Tax=Paracoccus sp. TaxID=267 RepID=UPI0026E074D1|nr:L,D-transpeptidase family protein [Paracoccus sp. (in: a-proteobacteria)]